MRMKKILQSLGRVLINIQILCVWLFIPAFDFTGVCAVLRLCGALSWHWWIIIAPTAVAAAVGFFCYVMRQYIKAIIIEFYL